LAGKKHFFGVGLTIGTGRYLIITDWKFSLWMENEEKTKSFFNSSSSVTLLKNFNKKSDALDRRVNGFFKLQSRKKI
jgi:hypothetical protein